MDDRERAKRNRPSFWLLMGVMLPSIIVLIKVFGLGLNLSFLIGLALAVVINLAIKRPWRDSDDDWPGQRQDDWPGGRGR